MTTELWSAAHCLQAEMFHKMPSGELVLWKYLIDKKAILLTQCTSLTSIMDRLSLRHRQEGQEGSRPVKPEV